MLTGPPLGSRRQDILREPWFLGTLLGCIGGLLWLAFCIVSIWLYRRRKAVAGRKLKHKNMAAYSGIIARCDLNCANVIGRNRVTLDVIKSACQLT